VVCALSGIRIIKLFAGSLWPDGPVRSHPDRSTAGVLAQSVSAGLQLASGPGPSPQGGYSRGWAGSRTLRSGAIRANRRRAPGARGRCRIPGAAGRRARCHARGGSSVARGSGGAGELAPARALPQASPRQSRPWLRRPRPRALECSVGCLQHRQRVMKIEHAGWCCSRSFASSISASKSSWRQLGRCRPPLLVSAASWWASGGGEYARAFRDVRSRSSQADPRSPFAPDAPFVLCWSDVADAATPTPVAASPALLLAASAVSARRRAPSLESVSFERSRVDA